MNKQKINRLFVSIGTAAIALAFGASTHASSHMDAPLMTFDPAANLTDVYAFVTERDGEKYLVTALSVYPFEEPGIGPNNYRFDDSVLYSIRVATTNASGRLGSTNDLVAGVPTHTFNFAFRTHFKNKRTILQAYTGVVTNLNDPSQNMVQTYQVFRGNTLIGRGLVPPNNQGIVTPAYNQGDNGENPAKEGVADEQSLDRYTRQAIFSTNGFRFFAGQRDDAFYGDIQAIFDLLNLRDPGVDAQRGFNVHTIVLEIPMNFLGGDQQIVGVWGTTSRKRVSVLRDSRSFSVADLQSGVPFSEGISNRANDITGPWIQVSRLGNPLFNEGLVAIADKDLYNRSSPATDAQLFRKYARNPELAKLLNAVVFGGQSVAPETNRTDIVGIFIPDMIKVDLSTGPARLQGAGADDSGYSRLSIFGGDTLTSQIQPGFGNGTVPGGWPNGRRFGDDVVDIAVTALISDLRTSPPTIRGPAGDNVNNNDITYHKVFPYAATPLNGRNHTHH